MAEVAEVAKQDQKPTVPRGLPGKCGQDADSGRGLPAAAVQTGSIECRKEMIDALQRTSEDLSQAEENQDRKDSSTLPMACRSCEPIPKFSSM